MSDVDETKYARLPLEEFDIRHWFCSVDLEQAMDTFRVVEGILQARQEAQPKRKKRSDAGQQRIELKEPRKAVGAPLQDADIDEDCR
jgi:hypothetical protein